MSKPNEDKKAEVKTFSSQIATVISGAATKLETPTVVIRKQGKDVLVTVKKPA